MTREEKKEIIKEVASFIIVFGIVLLVSWSWAGLIMDTALHK